jgi:hypothetical protein
MLTDPTRIVQDYSMTCSVRNVPSISFDLFCTPNTGQPWQRSNRMQMLMILSERTENLSNFRTAISGIDFALFGHSCAGQEASNDGMLHCLSQFEPLVGCLREASYQIWPIASASFIESERAE